MKKSIFAIALMASLLAGAAEDSYLYWMVNVNENEWGYSYSAQVSGKNGDDSTVLNLYYANGNSAGQSIGKTALQAYKDTGFGFYALLGSAYTSYVFEILGDRGDVVWSSEEYDANAVAQYVARNDIRPPTLQPLTMHMALPAPEPSSGLLLLLGVAGLALRRRKQVAA